MSNTALATTEHQLDDKTLFALVTDGDCRKLNDAQKLAYYKARCDAAGLDYRAQPFQFISLNGKLVLYALKACTDQLSAKHGIRCEILSQATEEGIRVVTVRAISADGRATDEIGAVSVKGLQGDALCNALMKATTKAKRRAILAVCGLGLLDESEMETIPSAKLEPAPTVQMPRRLSDKQQPEYVVSQNEPEMELVTRDPALAAALARGAKVVDLSDDDVEALLQASLDLQREPVVEPDVDWPTPESEPAAYIDESQRRHLLGLARENKHDPKAVKAWLARRGVTSSKLIRTDQYDVVRKRLASAEPLEA